MIQYNGYSSALYVAAFSIPQGSDMRSVLFAIYINDIVDVLSVNSLLFVDDLKIFNIIDSTEDQFLLQNNIDSLLGWYSRNELTLNSPKCAVQVERFCIEFL